MINPPKTLKEAMRKRYGRWSGNPNGRRYRMGGCAWEIFAPNHFYGTQCSRRSGHGPNGLFCQQHANKIAEK